MSSRRRFEASSRALISACCFSRHCLELMRYKHGMRWCVIDIPDNLRLVFWRALGQNWGSEGRGLRFRCECCRRIRRRGLKKDVSEIKQSSTTRERTHCRNFNVRELALKFLNLIIPCDLHRISYRLTRNRIKIIERKSAHTSRTRRGRQSRDVG